MDTPIEIWIDKMATVNEFAQKLQEIFKKDLYVTKINSPWSFHRVTLPFSEWILPTDPLVS